MAEHETNQESSYDFLQEKLQNRPQVTEPTSPSALDIQELTKDEALEMYLNQPDEVVYMMTGYTKDELKAMAAERALNNESPAPQIDEENKEKPRPQPALQVETIEVDTKYIEENKDKHLKPEDTRQTESSGHTSSSLTNKQEGRDGKDERDDGYER